MKGKLFRERIMRVANNKKLSKSLLTFVNTLKYLWILGKIKQKKEKSGICYYLKN